jgi:proteasome activator subunit 4
MGYIASQMSKFFHPAAIDEMLSEFVPMLNGTNLDVRSVNVFGHSFSDLLMQKILSSQYYMVTFLPTSHPQSYLPMLFRVWHSVNS